VTRGIYTPNDHKWHATNGERELLVLPGVELRVSQITQNNNAINAHVIFDGDRVSAGRLINDFLGNLPLDPTHGDQTLRASRAHLLALGRAHQTGRPPNLNESLAALSAGEEAILWSEALGAASVSIDQLIKILNQIDSSIPGGKAHLLVVANSGHGGLHELPWTGHAATVRQRLIREADLLFSSNVSDRAFLLGEHPGTPSDECRARFGRLKACVWGSDAKTTDKLLHPSNGNTTRYTWIKSGLSFEGLKQLIYEPKDRVSIQELRPDDRPWNSMIDAVRFLDDAKSGISSEDWIPVSENLTSLIGGKSSGKSLLLHLIAKTVDPAQVRERVGPDRHPYDQIEQDVSFQVRWKNEDTQTLGGTEVAPSRITYLPQTYINQLAEPESQEQLADVVLRLLREDSAFSEADEQFRRSIDVGRSTVVGQVQKLFEIRRQIAEVEDRLSTFGKESAIEAEISRLQEVQAEILKDAGLSPEDEEAYGTLQKQIAEHTDRRQQRLLWIEAIVTAIEELTSLSERSREELKTFDPSSTATPPAEIGSRPAIRKVLSGLAAALTFEFERAINALRSEQRTLEEANIEEEKAIQGLRLKLEPYEGKFASRERAKAASESEAKQKHLLAEVREDLQRLERLRGRLNDAILRAIDGYRAIYNTHRLHQ
jgi:hypothetical protein